MNYNSRRSLVYEIATEKLFVVLTLADSQLSDHAVLDDVLVK